MTWTPSPGEIHIHYEAPLRLAIPWARFNVFVTDFEFVSWDWVNQDMDMIVTKESVSEMRMAIKEFRKIFDKAMRKQHLPSLPVPSADPKPKIAILTLTRNRKAWWANMVANVMRQAWPTNLMEWIIVDDGDEDQRLGKEVDEFMEKSPGIKLRYVEVATVKTIGAKRNIAVENASEDIDVFVCMDDDDHYPKESIATRLAWFKRELPAGKPQSQIVYCSVIAMYDLTRYISAMNVPELELSPAERISEATLAFTREAWTAKPFPDVNMAEGFGFAEDRDAITVEIPPKGVIVSFIHTGNSSSRRIPKDQEPNGCHYGFPDEYFRYLHTVGGGMTD